MKSRKGGAFWLIGPAVAREAEAREEWLALLAAAAPVSVTRQAWQRFLAARQECWAVMVDTNRAAES